MSTQAIYCDYFGFTKDPFSIAPDPALLYPSEQHKQALAHLKYGLDREGGFILLTGEVGTGKTTLTRFMLQKIIDDVRVAYIINTKLSSEALLFSICQELDIDLPDSARTDISQSIEHLNKNLLVSHGQKKKTLVVIEEAQNLNADTLETLRLLTNLETNTTKLLHILLVAQPELLETLAQPKLRQLNQRVVSRHHLLPLELSDVENYLHYRVENAGGHGNLFSSQTIKRFYRHSNGIPRVLNLLAEKSLLGAYSKGKKLVTSDFVDQANIDVFGVVKTQNKLRSLTAVAAVAILCAGLWLTAMFNDHDNTALSTNLAAESTLTNRDGSVVIPINKNESMTASAAAVIDHKPPAAQQLLKLWRPATELEVKAESLCSIALIEGLNCKQLNNLSLEQVQRMNRPGIVTLQVQNDSLERYLIQSINADVLTLSNAESVLSLSRIKFNSQWMRDYQILWQAPDGYSQALYPGMENPVVVNWLLMKLTASQPEVADLITGGIYSEAVAQYVKKFQQQQGLSADGILGTQTIMSLTETSDDQPVLHKSGQG